MPAYTLKSHSESEVCFSTYYDISDQVPAVFRTEDGEHFRYKAIDIRQDPLSHHLIVDVFRGTEAANDPAWGVYHCRGGEHDGTVCDPLDLTACGSGGCATDPDPTAIACIVVFFELWAIAFIRARYMDTPFLQAAFQIVLGGVIVLAVGILIGGAWQLRSSGGRARRLQPARASVR